MEEAIRETLNPERMLVDVGYALLVFAGFCILMGIEVLVLCAWWSIKDWYVQRRR